MTDRQVFEERIGQALRAQADEAIRAFDPTEIASLAAASGSRLPRPWASLVGRRNLPLRWVVLAAALLLLSLAAIAGLAGASHHRPATQLGSAPLFVAQMLCDPGCTWPTCIRASTIDPQSGRSTASWELPYTSTSMAGPPTQPAWSPDRRHVLLYDWNNGLVAIVDVATGSLATPAGDDPSGITGYAWSPQSDRIARASGGAADGVSIDDLTLHQLARFEVPSHAMIDSPPEWSPDGSALVVTGCFPCDTSWQGSPHTPHQRRLFIMPVDGSPIRPIAITSASELGKPAWSPDGRTVAFGTIAGIGTVSVSDGQEQAVTSGFANDPRWSPDGSRLAFASAADRTVGGIVVVDADGGHRTQLTNGVDSRPVWSPDGNWIAFSRDPLRSDGDPRPGDIMIIPAVGGEPRLISTEATAGW